MVAKVKMWQIKLLHNLEHDLEPLHDCMSMKCRVLWCQSLVVPKTSSKTVTIISRFIRCLVGYVWATGPASLEDPLFAQRKKICALFMNGFAFKKTQGPNSVMQKPRSPIFVEESGCYASVQRPVWVSFQTKDWVKTIFLDRENMAVQKGAASRTSKTSLTHW